MAILAIFGDPSVTHSILNGSPPASLYLFSFFSLYISFSKITHFCGIQTKIISIEGEALTTVPTPRPMCDIFLETIQIALG